MRLIVSAFLLASVLAAPVRAAELRIISPGIVYNAALSELVDDYNKKSGNTAIIVRATMDKLIAQAKTDTPAADVVGLPADLMNSLYLDGGIVARPTRPWGGRVGPGGQEGAAKPDISTVAKLAAVLKTAQAVMVNDPKGGTMQGVMIDGILKRPEFAGTRVVPSARGEGAAALARGEGDMAVQLVQEILNKPEIDVVAPLPVERADIWTPSWRCVALGPSQEAADF
jgi:hypothetical protein